MARLYAAARLHVNFFQPSFKLKEKRREGARVIKRYHAPATPYARALAHPKVSKAVKRRLRQLYRKLDPVALLSEVRAAQVELGSRVDRRGKRNRGASVADQSPAPDAATFAKGLGKMIEGGEPRATHRQIRRLYKTRVRMPSILDPHVAAIEGWLAVEPTLTALAIVGRLSERAPTAFGPKQTSIVQKLLKTLRTKTALQQIAASFKEDRPLTSAEMRPANTLSPSNIPP